MIIAPAEKWHSDLGCEDHTDGFRFSFFFFASGISMAHRVDEYISFYRNYKQRVFVTFHNTYIRPAARRYLRVAQSLYAGAALIKVIGATSARKRKSRKNYRPACMCQVALVFYVTSVLVRKIKR